jgi:hypothetical protein
MWHPDIPELQLSWDATSLKEIMFCPRRYHYSQILGFKTEKESHHLVFGRYYHSALGVYDSHLAANNGYAIAREEAVLAALFYGYGWNSEDKAKNRFSLWRTVQWYTEQYPPDKDVVKTVVDSDGKPLIEQRFSFSLPFSAPNGYDYICCGYFDSVVEAMQACYVRERKTTGKTVNTEWFQTFGVDIQIDIYSIGCKICFDVPVRGVLIDGAQVAVNFSRFYRAPSLRTEPQLEETLVDVEHWIKQAEQYALERYWPKASRFCFMCPFRVVCSKDPASRTAALLGNFRVEDWDPTLERSEA